MATPAIAPVQKQRINVYTMMLILSFFALVAACVLLWLELSSYNEGKYPYWDTSSARTARLSVPDDAIAGPNGPNGLNGLNGSDWARGSSISAHDGLRTGRVA